MSLASKIPIMMCLLTKAKGLSRALTMSAAGPKPIKVLALHGKGGNGASMALKIAPLVEATESDGFQWTFPTAPHALESGGTAWWMLPPGRRSFEADSFEGVDESLACLREVWDREGPFDCIMGHSQGAMLTAILVAQNILASSPSSPSSSTTPPGSPNVGLAPSSSTSQMQPKCAILSGAAWPNPYGELFHELAVASSAGAGGSKEEATITTTLIPTLHCWGTQDEMNPPELAQKLQECFAKSSVWVHEGGHVVPLDAASLDTFRAFVQKEATSPNRTPLPEEPEWGVSLIGGDPCSSAYNDDPFNAQQNAQDSWLEARKAKRQRVAAKVKELEQTERERLGVKDSTDRKSARPGRDVYKGGDARRWFT